MWISLGMPIFYTHLDNGHGYEEDELGSDYPDEAAARQAALSGGVDIMANELKQGCAGVRLTIYVDDARRARIAAFQMYARVE